MTTVLSREYLASGGGSTGDATAKQWDIKNGKDAYIASGKVTGSGYFPALQLLDGSSGYYSKTGLTFIGNKYTAVFRMLRDSFTGDTFERVVWVGATGGARFAATVFSSNHSSFPNRLGKLQLDVQNNAGVGICKLISSSSVLGVDSTVKFEFDGDAGTAEFIINGVDADDTGNADRSAPTTGNLATASGFLNVGAGFAGTEFYGGRIGFFGYRDVGGLTWSDFMQTDGSPKQINESTWAEWGSVQPEFFHESAKMDENEGSAGAMTKNGSIILAPASIWS